ncbi:phasin family protein [Ancylobacter sp. A5.8]|uniref:phasin family protein n=1 Tax=Ancylobacter gelatini TaxID=2919920 RepID=UPI001F4DDD2B|nr:phasin family protein [Ancylobacter gelatini]MCJ8143744.1 phasin family protein [Ancylobacter gelatini]
MANNPKLEIPHELRSVAEQGVDQARAAVDGLIAAAHKAFDDAGRQVDAAHDNARELGRTSVGFAETNIAASFDFASRLAKAQTMEEWTRLHAEFVTEQVHRLSEQAKVLGRAGISAPGLKF